MPDNKCYDFCFFVPCGVVSFSKKLTNRSWIATKNPNGSNIIKACAQLILPPGISAGIIAATRYLLTIAAGMNSGGAIAIGVAIAWLFIGSLSEGISYLLSDDEIEDLIPENLPDAVYKRVREMIEHHVEHVGLYCIDAPEITDLRNGFFQIKFYGTIEIIGTSRIAETPPPEEENFSENSDEALYLSHHNTA